MISISSETVYSSPQTFIARDGQSSAQRKQSAHWAAGEMPDNTPSPSNKMGVPPIGQALTHQLHLPRPMHLFGYMPNFRPGAIVSGFEHQIHESEQPEKKTSVRMPGPSWIVYFCMFVTRPAGLSFFV
jgi:hypothetical protein